MKCHEPSTSAEARVSLEPLVRRLSQQDLDVLAERLRMQIESGEFSRAIEERLRPYRDNLGRYDPFLILD